jgi:hypothetical protein
MAPASNRSTFSAISDQHRDWSVAARERAMYRVSGFR